MSFGVVVGVAFGVLAQDRAALLDRVDRASAEATEVGVSARDRIEALDRALETRRALMGALPEDAHRPIWMLDQAADTLTRLTLAMADTRLVVGVLDQWERAEALAAAETAYMLSMEAGERIDARFERQQHILDAGGELAEGDRALNRRLSESEVAVRRPLLMGRAMALLVAGEDDVAEASVVLQGMDGLRVGPGAARVIRDNALAMTLAKLGGTKNRQRAMALLDGVLADEPHDAGPLALAEAALLRGRLAEGADARAQALAEAADRAPFVDAQGLSDPALLVLATEARARVLLEGGRLESAVRVLIGLVDRRELGGTAEQRAALADDRLAALAAGVSDWEGVAPDAVLRVARALVARDRRSLDEQAVTMLATLLERFDAQREQAGKAGKPWTPPPEQASVMELLARLDLATAETLADRARASERRARAVVLVLGLIGFEGVDLGGLLSQAATLSLGAAGEGLNAGQRRVLLEAALERAPGHARADRWRLGLAALLIEDGDDWPRALDLAEAAMKSKDGPTRDDATALAGAAHAMLVSRAQERDRASLPILRRAMAFTRAHPKATDIDAPALGLRIAVMLVESGRIEDAREAIEALRGTPGKQALVLRARALDTSGKPDEAFAAYREASNVVSRQADGVTHWLIWTRLLELLDAERLRRIEAGGIQGGEALGASIRAHLLRLRAEDAELGGAPWAGRLRRIEAGLGG